MRTLAVSAATVLAGVAAAVMCAAPAPATPECTNVGASTRVCSNPGHTAITTSPNPALTNPYPGPYPAWGFGGIGIPAIGWGGGGIWIGF